MLVNSFPNENKQKNFRKSNSYFPGATLNWTLFYQSWVHTNCLPKLKVCIIAPVTKNKFLYKL